jgi:serine/threonine protein kinase
MENASPFAETLNLSRLCCFGLIVNASSGQDIPMEDGKRCAQCGGLLPDKAMEGLCRRCLGRLVLEDPVEWSYSAEAGLCLSVAQAQTPQEKRIERFGDYELLDEVASGAMGIVYRARQVSLNRIVALKMILSHKLNDPELIGRFYTEAKAAARLQHPHIVVIHDLGEIDGQPFYTMDFVEGQSLAQMVQNYPLPPRRAAGYVKV